MVFRFVGQALAPVLVAAKSLEAANELIVKAAAPVFVSVTVIGALVVARSEERRAGKEGGYRRPGDEPCQHRENISGLARAASARDSVPGRAPVAVGATDTLIL